MAHLPQPITLWRQVKASILNREEGPHSLIDCGICRTGKLLIPTRHDAAQLPNYTWEKCVVLPCGHLVGHTCWAEKSREFEANGNESDWCCPVCQLDMHFAGCGHQVEPREISPQVVLAFGHVAGTSNSARALRALVRYLPLTTTEVEHGERSPYVSRSDAGRISLLCGTCFRTNTPGPSLDISNGIRDVLSKYFAEEFEGFDDCVDDLESGKLRNLVEELDHAKLGNAWTAIGFNHVTSGFSD